MMLWLLFAMGLGLCCLVLVRLIVTRQRRKQRPTYYWVWAGRVK